MMRRVGKFRPAVFFSALILLSTGFDNRRQSGRRKSVGTGVETLYRQLGPKIGFEIKAVAKAATKRTK